MNFFLFFIFFNYSLIEICQWPLNRQRTHHSDWLTTWTHSDRRFGAYTQVKISLARHENTAVRATFWIQSDLIHQHFGEKLQRLTPLFTNMTLDLSVCKKCSTFTKIEKWLFWVKVQNIKMQKRLYLSRQIFCILLLDCY